MDLGQIKRVGIAAAYKGGEILRSHFGRLTEIAHKGAIDLVTEADTGSEAAILEIIKKRYPDHGIVAEESGTSNGSSRYCWTIDPLDGTTNFAHQVGLVGVSIAFAVDQQVQVGIVLNPFSAELFTAIAGRGAALNDNPICVSDTSTVDKSLLATGFPYNKREMMDELLPRLGRVLSVAQGVRRLGAAALDLCYVACGRFDGFWEQNLQEWDTAAGVLIAREAGAEVTDFSKGTFLPEKKEILATNGKIHQELHALLHK